MEHDEQKKRRPYHEPRVERVQLMLEDALLSACKIPGHGCDVPPFGGRDPGS